MKIKYIMLALVAILSLSISSCSGGDSNTSIDEEGIRESFFTYKNSILTQNGIEAVKQVNSSTIEYYGEMKDIALVGTEEKVRNLSTLNKLMVLMIRHLIEPSLLSEMTAEDVFVWGVDEGLIGEDAVGSSLGDITIADNVAIARYIQNGQVTVLNWQFEKEDGAWRLDLTSILKLAAPAFKEAIKSSGMSEDEFIFMALETASGRKVSDDIWKPVASQ